jgi:integrase
VRYLRAAEGLRNRVALATAYAAGLPIGEVVRLKVASIDSQRMLLLTDAAKGGRDRYAMLSPRLLDILRAYSKRAQPRLWLFPGQESGDHLSTGALQDACRIFGSPGSSLASADAPAVQLAGRSFPGFLAQWRGFCNFAAI